MSEIKNEMKTEQTKHSLTLSKILSELQGVVAAPHGQPGNN